MQAGAKVELVGAVDVVLMPTRAQQTPQQTQNQAAWGSMPAPGPACVPVPPLLAPAAVLPTPVPGYTSRGPPPPAKRVRYSPPLEEMPAAVLLPAAHQVQLPLTPHSASSAGTVYDLSQAMSLDLPDALPVVAIAPPAAPMPPPLPPHLLRERMAPRAYRVQPEKAPAPREEPLQALASVLRGLASSLFSS